MQSIFAIDKKQLEKSINTLAHISMDIFVHVYIIRLVEENSTREKHVQIVQKEKFRSL